MKTELGKVIDIKSASNGFIFKTANGSLEVGFYNPDSILFEYNVDSYDVPEYLDDSIKELYNTELSYQNSVLSEKPDCWSISLENTEILVSKDNATVTVYRNGLVVHGGKAGGKDTVIPQSQFSFISEGKF